MSFPLSLQTLIAPGADLTADPPTWTWVDISEHVKPGIKISRGRPDEFGRVPPSRCMLALNNAGGRFVTRNPLAPWYPLLRRNTPLRVRLQLGGTTVSDTFSRTVAAGSWGTATSGQSWTTHTSPATDYSVDGTNGRIAPSTIGGDHMATVDLGSAHQDVRVLLETNTTPVGASIRYGLVGRFTDASNYYRAVAMVTPAGVVSAELGARVGGTLTVLGSAVTSLAISTNVWVRFRARGSRIQLKLWQDGSPEPSGWDVDLRDVTVPGGTRCGPLARREAGNSSPTSLQFDSFTASVPPIDRFTGFVDEWPTKWEDGVIESYVDVVASGILRRLGQGDPPQKSALERYLTERQQDGLVAYWPGEDGPDASAVASAVDEVGPLSPDVAFRSGQAAPASGVTLMFDPTGAELTGPVPRRRGFTTLSWPSSVHWRVEHVMSYPQQPTTNIRTLAVRAPGTVVRWDVNCGPAGFELEAVNLSGGVVLNITPGVVPRVGTLHHVRFDVTISGGTTTAELFVDGVSMGTDTTASVSNPPNLMMVNPDNATADVPLMGHIGVWAATPLPSTDSANVASGYVGEPAGTRMESVSDDMGVLFTGTDLSDTEPMGVRPSGNYLAVMRDAEASDAGILYELTDGQLSYLRREDLYNQAVALALDHEQGHLTDLKPTDDDQQLRNDVTASRQGGSSARYVDEESLAAEGRYEDPITVNPETDDRLLQHAAWRAHLGTVAEQRYPTVGINLTGMPSLHAGWLGCDIGSRITIANPPAEMPPDLIDLHIQGYEEYLDLIEWRVTLNCAPASPWTIGVLEDTTLGRLDTEQSVLWVANKTAKADNTSTANVITVADANAVGFSIGNRVVLHDENGYRKEPTVFTITAMPSAFGFTNITFTPAAQEPPSGTFGGSGDTVRRVDETSLSVETITGPRWGTTTEIDFPLDVKMGGEQITVTDIAPHARDAFTRTTANGWGTADVGGAWTTSGGVVGNYATTGTVGTHVVGAVNSTRATLLPVSLADGEWLFDVSVSAAATGGPIQTGMYLRYADASNHYQVRCEFNHDSGSGQTVTARVAKLVAGVESTVLSAPVPGLLYTATTWYRVRVALLTSFFTVRIWPRDKREPNEWTLQTTDGSLTAAGQTGCRSLLATGNTNGSVTTSYDNLLVASNPQIFTVTRAINGVEQGHAVGTDVRLWQPLTLGL